MQVLVQRTTVRGIAFAVAGLCVLLLLPACSSSISDRAAPAAATYGSAASIADAGRRGVWTTPPSSSAQAYASGTIRAANAPTVVRTVNAPATRYVQTTPAGIAYDVPPPPPPPSNVGYENWQAPPAPGGATAPAPTYVGPGTTVVDPNCGCPPPPSCEVCRPLSEVQPANPCWLPCENGISTWHVRGLIGFVTYVGDDPGEDCGYWGLDIGRTFCGCWGLDVFYRWNSGQFDRLQLGGGTFEDGGDWHHVGVKVTYEGRIGDNPRWTWWVGLGPEYYWTEDYMDDDSGFGIYAEAGVSFAVMENLRIRLGVGIHGMDTDVTRENPIDDGDNRWLWVIGPHIGLEYSF